MYPAFGKYEMAVQEAKKFMEINPDSETGYSSLAGNYIALGQLDDAETALRTSAARGVGTPDNLVDAYDIAFLRNDAAGMKRQVQLAESNPGAEDLIANREAYVAAYGGRAGDARKVAQRAADLPQQKSHQERAALFEAGSAVREAFLGFAHEATRDAHAALADSNNREVEYGAAFALALARDAAGEGALTADLEKRFPEDTSVRFNYVPTIRGLLALKWGSASQAIGVLQSAAPYELGQHRSTIHGNFGALYPIYVRGEAYLSARDGKAAAAEFQKILDHRGIVVSDPVGALPRLQLGRALRMSGDNARAREAYADFLALWKDADADVPVLVEAKRESAGNSQ